jgi:hypothetical protein
MWSNYQNKIIYYVFIPYCLYLIIIQFLTGYLIGNFFDSLTKVDKYLSSQQQIENYLIQACLLTPLCFTLLLIFGSLEIKQVFQNGLDYFTDFWNCIDMMSLYCNLLFLTMFTICIVKQEEYFSSDMMHIIGAYACFFMWIKIFYWMRLFSSLAYYVKLIYQTISDIRAFMLMVTIILTSFGAFLYVCNRNLTGR